MSSQEARSAACNHDWIVERPASATTSYEVCRRCGSTREVPSAAKPDYQIALRCNDLGLDDVVVKDVQMFRMERMSDNNVWLCCYLADGQRLDIDLWLDGRTVKYAAREDLPDAIYEEGSRAS